MAATGKTPILLYGSTTATNVPVAANLTNSSDGCEIAINVADKNLFFKDSTNAVNTVPIRQSSASSNGWLSSTDWSTFNNKQPAGTYVTSVTGTSPVSSSGGTTPAISLASGYGDTQNPYASKTANYVLAAPNGSSGVPTFRAIVAADIPTLNQNTTGSAGSVANSVTFTNTGGAAAGTTFNGSAARTIDYSTVGAPKTDGTGASGTWGIDISGNAATATNVTSGSYTPTLTNVGNVSSSTAFVTNYIRVGNVVSMSGRVTVVTIMVPASFTVGISLPIASNFTVAQDAAGTAASASATHIGATVADATNDRINLIGNATTTTSTIVNFSLNYVIK